MQNGRISFSLFVVVIIIVLPINVVRCSVAIVVVVYLVRVFPVGLVFMGLFFSIN